MHAEYVKTKQITLFGAVVEETVAIKRSEFSVEQNKDIADVIEVLVEVFRSTRNSSYYGRPPLRRAVFERLNLDGKEETLRVLGLYVRGMKARDPYRPAFSTPVVMLTNGWNKAVAFADRQEKKTGKLSITDESLREDIAKGLSNGGAK